MEDLAAEAAERSLELRGLVEKGARLRKKKALGDLLKALTEVGVSRRRSAVPPEDRTVQAWFLQVSLSISAIAIPPQPHCCCSVVQSFLCRHFPLLSLHVFCLLFRPFRPERLKSPYSPFSPCPAPLHTWCRSFSTTSRKADLSCSSGTPAACKPYMPVNQPRLPI